MTADPIPSRHRVVFPILALAALVVLLRIRFVDLLTKTTGTWIGGVESPHRGGAGIVSKDHSAD